MAMRPLFTAVLSIAACLIAFFGFQNVYNDPDECLISYRTAQPVYERLYVPGTTGKYALYLFRENETYPQLTDPVKSAHKLGGTPVLFIPGNAGSYKQGLALASLSSQFKEFDWFLIHFNEDLSALHGKTMVDEASFVNLAIKHILSLYDQADPAGSWDTKPSSVMVVAHSMGGVVARTLVTLNNFLPNSVNTIFTFSTPHAQPPITFDRDITQLYDVVGQWWRSQSPDSAVQLVSIAGGHMDLLVPPGLTLADSFGGTSVLSYEVPGVGIGINHLAIVWCVQLRKVVVETLAEIADHRSPGRTRALNERQSVVNRRFKHRREAQSDLGAPIPIGPKILYGFSETHVLHQPTTFELPARSSLVSYRVSLNTSTKVSHSNRLEFRDYGEVRETTLMWSTAPPYTPFPFPHPPKLNLELQPTKPVSVKISVDWPATFANIAVYYRTLSAVWPPAAVLAAYILTLLSNRRVSVSNMLLNGVLGSKFWWFASLLGLSHVALTFRPVRALCRAVQFPSEAQTVAGLAKRGYDDHDLLLGIDDVHLFWVGPLIFMLSCWAAVAMIEVSKLVVLATSWGSDKTQVAGVGEANKEVKEPREVKESEEESNRGKKASGGKEVRAGSWLKSRVCRPLAILKFLCLFAVLYTVPYQASTVILALIALLRLKKRESRLLKVQLLLWCAVVDAPIVVVWLRDFSSKWLMSFASFRNAGTVLPIAIDVLYPPLTTSPPSRVGKSVALSLLVYTTFYAILYGGLHAFMIHYLTLFNIFLELLLGERSLYDNVYV